jgi:Nucleotidyltransferase
MPPILEVLRKVDPTFREVLSQVDGRVSTQFVTRDKLKLAFLTLNRWSDDQAGKPVPMPALGGQASFRYTSSTISFTNRSARSCCTALAWHCSSRHGKDTPFTNSSLNRAGKGTATRRQKKLQGIDFRPDQSAKR